MVLVVILGVVVFAFVSLALRESQVEIVGLTEDGRVFPIPSTSEPYLDATRVRKWAQDAVVRTYEWNYKNFRERFREVENSFTEDGYIAWLKTLDETQRVKYIRDNNLLLSYVPRTVVVIGEGPARGVYRWRLEFSGSLIYSASGRADKKDDLNLIVDIERVDVRQNGIGLGIAQIVESR